jgi:hypothetical protein
MLKAFPIALAALALTSTAAGAAVITPVSATATSTFNNGFYSPTKLIDGSGLSAGLHDNFFGNMWMTDLGVNQAQVTFDLGGLYRLDAATIWNYNFGNPAEFQSTILRGVKDLRVLTSQDGNTFSEIFSGRLAMGTGQPLPGQIFDLDGRARFVQIDILNNYGQGTYAERDWSSGLSEVRFEGTAVPEPATWAMMIIGFGVVGRMMRRRQGNRYAIA